VTRTLFTGGELSYKSLAAELAMAQVTSGTYVATVMRDSKDSEWQSCRQRHRDGRPSQWTTIETVDVSTQIRMAPQVARTVVDCLTLWVSRRLSDPTHLAEANPKQDKSGQAPSAKLIDALQPEADDLADAVPGSQAEVADVTNEVRSGIVPESAIARTCRDALGLCNAQIATACDGVVRYVAGCPLTVKGGQLA
jgi:adenosylcobinamide kinase/adenosylcobinamide-phosphate guanylyltransferase